MHVVYVIAPMGGPEAYVRILQPYLEERGHRVSVIYLVPPPVRSSRFLDDTWIEYAPPGNVHACLGRLFGGFRAWALRVRGYEYARAVASAVGRLAAREPVTVIEVIEGIPVEGLARTHRVVVRAHGSDWLFRRSCNDGDRRHDDHLIAAESRQLNAALAVGAISSDLAQELRSSCTFSKRAIDVLPYPIDTVQFCPTKKPPAPDRGPVVLTVGRLERRKGTDLLVQAMRLVWELHPDAHLVLLGGESDLTRSDLLKMVPEEHRDKVEFPGFLPHDQLPAMYQEATICVAPSQYETFGYTVLEAQACGVPVVATRVGAIPELVEDGTTGVLVPFNDVPALGAAVAGLLSDPVRRSSLSRSARRNAERYDLRRIGPRHEEWYLGLACGCPS